MNLQISFLSIHTVICQYFNAIIKPLPCTSYWVEPSHEEVKHVVPYSYGRKWCTNYVYCAALALWNTSWRLRQPSPRLAASCSWQRKFCHELPGLLTLMLVVVWASTNKGVTSEPEAHQCCKVAYQMPIAMLWRGCGLRFSVRAVLHDASWPLLRQDFDQKTSSWSPVSFLLSL